MDWNVLGNVAESSLPVGLWISTNRARRESMTGTNTKAKFIWGGRAEL